MYYKKFNLRYGFAILGAVFLVMAGCSTGNNPDTTDPVINSITHSPTPVHVGEQVTINVDAQDNRSAVTIKFDFNGDGIYETTNNTHTYNEFGSKKVGVQVSDQAGNTTVQDYIFDVLPAQGVLTVQNNSQYSINLFVDDSNVGQIDANSTRAFTLSTGTHSITGRPVDPNVNYIWGPQSIDLSTSGQTITFSPF